MDRTCADLPWQVWLEVDGKDIEIPKVNIFQFLKICILNITPFQVISDESFLTLSMQDSEGLIVLNIGSYMGGVNLWQNDYEHDDDFSLQSMHDKILEVVCVCGAWHLGKLQV